MEAKAGRTRRQFPPRRSAVVCFTYACCGAIYPFIPVGNWTVLPVAFRIREGDIIWYDMTWPYHIWVVERPTQAKTEALSSINDCFSWSVMGCLETYSCEKRSNIGNKFVQTVAPIISKEAATKLTMWSGNTTRERRKQIWQLQPSGLINDNGYPFFSSYFFLDESGCRISAASSKNNSRICATIQ